MLRALSNVDPQDSRNRMEYRDLFRLFANQRK